MKKRSQIWTLPIQEMVEGGLPQGGGVVRLEDAEAVDEAPRVEDGEVGE